MLRKATCKRSKLMLDLNLIMQRSKLAGKAITHLLTFNHNHHHHHHHHRSLPCFYMDPMMSYYNPNPREVEFSCSNTPSNSKSNKHGKHHHHHHNHHQLYDAEAIAKVFEILNDVEDDHGDQSLISSPSPLMMLGQVRQLRITDSPFPVKEEESDGFRVDLEAEEFIRRFYEQLRLQPASTPEYFSSHRRSPLLARA
ncbi:uncharacterized protein LOC120281195 [Dioscorea cayenensis subsp. rotundata]|uniref:Uncharacterized protein LOC120281195 n=1 Tax=Dioscorea cayennensis subsp. rotundata TaxID=55577 RepID=A0AB40CXA7_DIOCR|nr:uncharacterized protein LOC120281195 [Dioscorea cayenensis subsp. rotundata]